MGRPAKGMGKCPLHRPHNHYIGLEPAPFGQQETQVGMAAGFRSGVTILDGVNPGKRASRGKIDCSRKSPAGQRVKAQRRISHRPESWRSGGQAVFPAGLVAEAVDRPARLHLTLVAEHGGWMREADGQWRSVQVPNEEWKRTIRPILERYSDRTQGAFVEEKDFSLVWHYRRADPMQGAVRAHELRETLMSLVENMDVGVFEGNRVLEVRRLGISKGRVVARLVAQDHWDFLLAAGDDTADEEMFAALPPDAYSIRVGLAVSRASFNVDTIQNMRTLLGELAGTSDAAAQQLPPRHAQ